MSTQKIRDYFEEYEIEDAIIFEDPDFANAFIGHSEDGRAVYDYYQMVNCLKEEDHMTEEEAVEFIDYNTFRAMPYMGEKAPIVVFLNYNPLLEERESCTQQ